MWSTERVIRTVVLTIVTLVFSNALSADVSGASEGWNEPKLDTERHCAAKASSLYAEAAQAQTTAVCYGTFAEAIAFATGGRVQLSRTSPSRRLTEDELAPQDRGRRAPRLVTVIGIDYVDWNFGGNSLTWYTDNPNGCSDGTTYYASSMPSGWNDVVSSSISYQGCLHYYHYEHVNYGGARIDCWYCQTMGAMDNATSSEIWSRNEIPWP